MSAHRARQLARCRSGSRSGRRRRLLLFCAAGFALAACATAPARCRPKAMDKAGAAPVGIAQRRASCPYAHASSGGSLAAEPFACWRRACGHAPAHRNPSRSGHRGRVARRQRGAGDAVAPPWTYIPNPFIIPVGMVMGVLLAMPFGPGQPARHPARGRARILRRHGGRPRHHAGRRPDRARRRAGRQRHHRRHPANTARPSRSSAALALLGAGIKLYLTPADHRHRDARPRRRRCGTTSGTSRRRSSSPSPTPARCSA